MESYGIILKNDKLRSYRRIAVLILFLHLGFFIYYLLKVETDTSVFAGIGITVITLFFQFTAIKKNDKPLLPASIAFVLLALNWIFFQNYWLAIALLLLAFLNGIAGRKLLLSFFPDRIELPALPKRTILWNELNNVILKDRILTLDFKNDRLIQGEIDEKSFCIDERAFNGFCSQQLPQLPSSSPSGEEAVH